MVTKTCCAMCAQAFSSSAVVVIGCIVTGHLTRSGLFMATALFPAHARHVDELPWRGERSHRNLDQRRFAAGESLPQRRAQFLRRACTRGPRAETFGVSDEVRV